MLHVCLVTLSSDNSFCSYAAELQAKESVKGLRTRSGTADLKDPFALKARRYIYEERLRATLAHQLETKFPFVWEMKCSQQRFKAVIEDSALLFRELFFSRSAILRA